MKQYPSIKHSVLHDIDVFAFDKLDGSNIRAEWNKNKKTFMKFGTKTRLIGPDDAIFGEAISLINEKYGEAASRIFMDAQYERVVCFFEFFGKGSFAGQHINEKHDVILFDVDVYKRGLMPPEEFIDTFSHLQIPNVIHIGKIDDELELSMRNDAITGITFEGVVCKSNARKNGPVMFKIKTNKWLQKLRDKCGNNERLFNELA